IGFAESYMLKNEPSMVQIILIASVILFSYFVYWAVVKTKCRGKTNSSHPRPRTELITVDIDNEMSQRQHDREINFVIDDTRFVPKTPPPTYIKTIQHLGLPPPYTPELGSINNETVITENYSSSIGEGTTLFI
ncbi:9964_t:CDS:2, partial [Scutellospora calospora]